MPPSSECKNKSSIDRLEKEHKGNEYEKDG
jgi:hypothetical protein